MGLLSLDVKKIMVSVIFIIVLGITSESFCVPIVYDFSGTVTHISDPGYNLQLGDTFIGVLTYDYDLSLGIGNLGGNLFGVVANLGVDWGGGRTMSSSHSFPTVVEPYNGSTSSFYFGNPISNGLGSSNEDFMLYFSSIAFNNSIPDPEELIITGISFTTGYGTVTGTVAPVPEPATLVLFGAGLSGIAIWRRKRNSLISR